MTRKDKYDCLKSGWLAAMHEMGRAVAGHEPIEFDTWFNRRFPVKNKSNIKRNQR